MSELRKPPESNDFEWVNAWSTASKPATDDAPKEEPTLNLGSALDVAEQPVPQKAIAAAPASGVADVPHSTDVIAPAAAQSDIAEGVTHAPRERGPDAAQFVHPATRRFFAALRAPTGRSEPTAADAPAGPPAIAQSPQPPLVAAPASPVTTSPKRLPEPAPAAAVAHETTSVAAPVTTATSEPAVVESAEASLAPETSQLERDIADIECARDTLGDPAPSAIAGPRKLRGRLSALRHAESVPILVGSVVGATLLLVFGAAASLISLR